MTRPGLFRALWILLARAVAAEQTKAILGHSKERLERRTLALELLSGAFSAGTITDSNGLWEGNYEPMIQFEAIVGNGVYLKSQARQLAAQIASALDQDAVGLTFEPVDLELIAPPKATGGK